jgi:hypothetical protein
LQPRYLAGYLQRRIGGIFPQLGRVAIADIRSGVTGETVHGMPQIGQLRRGLWIASGFGGHGIGNAAMAGLLVSSGIVANDERWRMFSPFELVWSGGLAGRIAAQAVYSWTRGVARGQAALARYRERARLRDAERQRRGAEATRSVRTMRVPGQGARPRPPAVARVKVPKVQQADVARAQLSQAQVPQVEREQSQVSQVQVEQVQVSQVDVQQLDSEQANREPLHIEPVGVHQVEMPQIDNSHDAPAHISREREDGPV